ncbi:unnamed protein product [Gordionus sp. m RMFG-2023]|uniref:NECAP-like protein CG9132 n=1 Tax=Gordionus sp. m RMFG-2023 TaxID=3053472 RepID=UPI0030E37156
MDDYESVILVKNNVSIYNIAPVYGKTKYKAADWKLDNPDWTGRLKLISIRDKCSIKFEDADGKLFAACPVDKYPGNCIEGVSDSSRYFVIKLLSENGRSAFVGLGFLDRSDSFDLNVALQSHFRWLKDSKDIEKNMNQNKMEPSIDMSLKDGQTIKLNFLLPKNKESPSNNNSKLKPTCLVKVPISTSTKSDSNINSVINQKNLLRTHETSTNQVLNSNTSWETF